jgi:hypothetical protein
MLFLSLQMERCRRPLETGKGKKIGFLLLVWLGENKLASHSGPESGARRGR